MYKVAALDVGSSATRLTILSVDAGGHHIHTEYQRFVGQAGRDVFRLGHIEPDAADGLIQLCEQVGRKLRRGRVRTLRAVATSAMRDAANGAEICRAAAHRAGFPLEIISGEEEGHLSKQALIRALGSVPVNALLVDLGGGSLELESGGDEPGQSLPLGSVRLLASYPELRAPLTPEAFARVRAKISGQVACLAHPRKVGLLIGTGGNLEALSRLIGKTEGLAHRVEAAALEKFAETLAPLSISERIQQFHLHPDRAELTLPAILVLHALCTFYGPEGLIVPGTGLRDGLLYQLLARVAWAPRDIPPLHSSLLPACRLAERLFDVLTPLHHRWPPGRALLRPLIAAHAGSFRPETLPIPSGAQKILAGARRILVASKPIGTRVTANARLLASIAMVAQGLASQSRGDEQISLNILAPTPTLHTRTPLADEALEMLRWGLGRPLTHAKSLEA